MGALEAPQDRHRQERRTGPPEQNRQTGTMAELGAQEAMAVQGAQVAMAGLGALEAMESGALTGSLSDRLHFSDKGAGS